MVQFSLTNVEWAQKNKSNLDTMTLSYLDDERVDKEDRYEHDDEGSLFYAESTGDATEAASECADDDNTDNKTKKTTAAAAAVAKPRKKDQKPLDLNRLGDSRRVRHDAGRPSFFSSARCVIIGPTLLLQGIFCVGVVVNHAR
jgi:hypothetical protein